MSQIRNLVRPRTDSGIIYLQCSSCNLRNKVPIPFPRRKGPVCGGCQKSLFDECFSCKLRIIGSPKIQVEDRVYCFKCAKSTVASLKEQLDKIYLKALEEFNSAQKAALALKAQWLEKKKQYLGVAYPFSTYGLGLCLIGSLASEAILPGKWLLGLFAGLIVWYLMWQKKRNELDLEFLQKNPEPTFAMAPPRKEEVSHYPLPSDSSRNRAQRFREDILDRDGHTCQSCGEPKSNSQLEVHHIITVANGGSDDPTNLISLCKYCHDREEWYGHVRKYPTTL